MPFSNTLERPPPGKFQPMANTRAIYHRGLVIGDNEENTWAAFRDAAARGHGIEIDVQPTIDDYVIVMHDSNTLRTTGVEGNVTQMTFSEANALKTLGGADVPSLKQALAAEAPVTLVDIKNPPGWTDAALTRIATTLDELDAFKRVYLFTRDAAFIRRIEAIDSRMKTMYRPGETEAYSVASIQELGCHGVLAWAESMAQWRVDNFQDAFLTVYIQNYSVNSQAELQRLIGLGVNGVIIDGSKWDAWT